MIKKLSLIGGLMIMFLSLNSLYAEEKITILTNDIYFSIGYTGFSGLLSLFTVEGENGFCAYFSIRDSFVSSNTVIEYIAVFSNKRYMKEFRKYTDELMDLENGFLINSEMSFKYLCDVFKNDYQISKYKIFPFFEYRQDVFEGELVFKDGFKHSYIFNLPNEYKDAIYKKIEWYNKEKQDYCKSNYFYGNPYFQVDKYFQR